MSNNFKLSLALIFTFLLLGGCTPSPEDFPPILANVVTVAEAPSA